MTEKSFKIDKKVFERRKLTTLQHKLRVVLKCYTIRDFKLDENNNFSFKKSYRINGIKLDEKKELQGSFRTEELNEKEIILYISIF